MQWQWISHETKGGTDLRRTWAVRHNFTPEITRKEDNLPSSVVFPEYDTIAWRHRNTLLLGGHSQASWLLGHILENTRKADYVF